MKKILSIVLFIALMAAMAACGSQAQGGAHVEGELTDLFVKIYENADAPFVGTYEVVVDDSNKAGMLGSAEVQFTEGLASEAAIMTIPHSMVLIRVDSKTDIEKTKQLIRDNVDPRKWICVGVDPENVIVDNIGDLIFLVMSENAKAYHEGFLKLAE